MNILLIGGGGFLGLNLARALAYAGHQVHIADLNLQSVSMLQNIKGFCGSSPLDIANPKEILDYISSSQINCVFNLASNLIPSSSYEAYTRERTDFSSSITTFLDSLAEKEVGYVYFSSGGTVYGSSTKSFVNEADPKNPISYYGLSKLWHEELILNTSRTKNLHYIILRPSNPFGPLQNPHKKQGLIAVAVDKMRRNEDIEIWGDGSVVRDYIWVGDLCHAVVSLLEKGCWNEIYNIGSGVGHSINEVLSAIQSLLDTQSKIFYSPARIEDVKHIVLDVQKLRSAIEFHPIDLKRGIELYIRGLDSIQDHPLS